MADIGMAEDALVQVIAGYLVGTPYTSPEYQPETVITSVATVLANVSGTNQLVNCRCRIFRGWPIPDDLNIDLKNGVTEVSVFSTPGMSRLLDGYLGNSYVAFTVPITFTAVATNNTVTFGGTATIGQVTGIAVGDGIIKKAYCIRLANTDTPTIVAATLAALIPGASSVGPVVTVSGVTSLLTGVTSDSTINNELSRYSQCFDVSIWSPNPQSRDAVANVISVGMAQNLDVEFSDGSNSEISYFRGNWTEDAAQDTTSWFRRIRYEVPYPILTQTIVTGVLFLGVDLNSTHLVGEFDYRTF